MEDEPLPKRRRSPDININTPERPPHSPISAQQSPGPHHHDRPIPRSQPYGDDDDRYDEGTSRAYHGRSYLAPETIDQSRSPSVNGQTRSASPPQGRQLGYKQRLILRGHKKGISEVKFSPDGKWIGSCSADGSVKIWDSASGKLQHTLEGHLAGISTISWSPDSKVIASGSDDKTIRLWDVETGKAHPTPFNGHHNYVYSIAFSPKGNMIVSGSYDEAVFLWDVRTATPMRSLPAHSDPVAGVDFVRDGTLIASCAKDGLIRIWDTATGQCLRTLVHDLRAAVTSCRFSPNGKYVLAWTLDSSIRLWDYVTGKGRCVKTYQGHENTEYALSGCFGVYGTKPYEYGFVASGSEDGRILIWDVSSKNILQILEGHTAAVLSVDAHPTERVIVSAGLDRTIRVWRSDEPVEQQHAEELNIVKTTEDAEVPQDMRDEMVEIEEQRAQGMDVDD